MNPIELSAYKFKIQNASGGELDRIVDEIIASDPFPQALVPELIATCKRGVWLDPWRLCDVIANTGSCELYEHAKDRRLIGAIERIYLLRKGFLDSGLEEAVARELYSVLHQFFMTGKQDSGMREMRIQVESVEAMKENGREKSLEVLLVIQRELQPKLLQLETIHEGKDFKDEVDEFVDGIDFGYWRIVETKVNEAIEAIQQRLGSEKRFN